jgi:hypothetical protein
VVCASNLAFNSDSEAKAELHRAEALSREEAFLRAEAEASLRQLTLDKEELFL